MGRYGPGVLPYASRSFAEHLSNALQTGMQTYQQRKQQQQSDEERQRATAMQDFTLSQQHVRLTKPGEVPHELSRIGQIDTAPITPDWGAQARGESATPQIAPTVTPSQVRVGEGWVQDVGARDAERAAEAKRTQEAAFAQALLNAQIPRLADPEGHALGRRKTLAQITALETPKPVAPTRMSTVTTDAGVFAFNPVTGDTTRRLGDRPRPQGGAGGASGQGKPATEGERRGGALLSVAKDAYPVLATASAPSRVDAAKARFGYNEGLSQERQLVEQAARQFTSSYLYLVSGATASPQEVDNLVKQVVPQPGDKPATITRKRAAQRAMLEAMHAAAGRAGGESPVDANPWGP